MSQNQNKKFKNYYIYLGKGYNPAHDPDEIAVENSKMQRRGWEILVRYFGTKEKSDIFRFIFDNGVNEGIDQVKQFFTSQKIDSKFIPGCFIGEGLLNHQVVEAIINVPLHKNLISGPPSPFFDFKFYQNEQERFNSSDYGSDVTFDATADEVKEVEALLKQADVKFGYLRIS